MVSIHKNVKKIIFYFIIFHSNIFFFIVFKRWAVHHTESDSVWFMKPMTFSAKRFHINKGSVCLVLKCDYCNSILSSKGNLKKHTETCKIKLNKEKEIAEKNIILTISLCFWVSLILKANSNFNYTLYTKLSKSKYKALSSD